jgi:hypothetical protein
MFPGSVYWAGVGLREYDGKGVLSAAVQLRLSAIEQACQLFYVP